MEEIPGYYYDPESKKYFRLTGSHDKNTAEILSKIKAQKEKLHLIEEKSKEIPSVNLTKSIIKHSMGYSHPNGFIKNVLKTQLDKMTLQQLQLSIISSSENVYKTSIKCLPDKNIVKIALQVDGSVEIINLNVTSNDAGFIQFEKISSSCIFPYQILNFFDSFDWGTRGIMDIMCGHESLCIWHQNSLIQEHIFNHDTRCFTVRNSNAPTVVLGLNNSIRIYHINQHNELIENRHRRQQFKFKPCSLKYHQLTQNSILCGSHTGNFYSIDIRQKKSVNKLFSRFKSVLSNFHCLQDGNLVILNSVGNEIKLFDLRMSDKTIFDFSTYTIDNPSPVDNQLSVDETSDIVCCVGQDKNVRLWNINDGSLYKTIETDPQEQFPSAYFSSSWKCSPGNPFLIVAGLNKFVHAYAINHEHAVDKSLKAQPCGIKHPIKDSVISPSMSNSYVFDTISNSYRPNIFRPPDYI